MAGAPEVKKIDIKGDWRPRSEKDDGCEWDERSPEEVWVLWSFNSAAVDECATANGVDAAELGSNVELDAG